MSLGHSSSAQLSRRSPVQHRLPLVYSLTELRHFRGKSINRQGCGVLHRDLNSSICASVADVLVGPPVKCLISDCLVNRIEASSRRCKKEWWEVKKRTQRIFAVGTDYVRVRAFCFVHASGGVYGGGEEAPPRPRKMVGCTPRIRTLLLSRTALAGTPWVSPRTPMATCRRLSTLS